MREGSKKAIIAALAANSGIAVAKFVGFALTGASSMLAEAVHSVADSGNQALLLLGAARGKRAATPEHPFGYARERYFWAFVVAIVIFLLGGVFAIYEGVEKTLHPHPLESPLVAVSILVVAVVLEGYSFHTAIVEARKLRGDSSWWEFIRHTKAAELPVILLEDLGALLGLLLALCGVGLAVVTGNPRFDGIGSIAIGVLLTAIAAVLAIEMRSLLVGEAARPEVIETIRQTMLEDPRLQRVIHMKTMHLGPDELLIGVKAEFDAELAFAELAQAIDEVEHALRARVPAARVIYIEPDVFRGGEA
ncbi:MAG: cation diffusion facilitator family transporter [Myxococcales bacterium]|nr:cation diffusion facilitator family transporter [Myxococcales bacterium]